ncbi:TetR/AcrR family transcriptional regulator [Patulibacter defluvii]|uniref:TetR/AcrR family transcriptional regulator n=1 Tax=Patulibacter defluvii TaxID=3095358 RepID=UPI002A764E2B|nr:TetR/AcrR family transcriptional regulator [Patulibacter sp. DM4]
MTTPDAKPGRPRARRTQEERRAATQAALLDATIDCLVDYGYAGTTTTKIVERAGVSRGAQVHHFPTKAALVAEAVRHLARRRTTEAVEELRSIAESPDPLDAVLDVLWESHQGPLFQAVLELWVAGRSDPALLEHIVEVEKAVTESLFEAVSELVGGDAEISADLVQDLNVAMSTIRGLALINQAMAVDGPAAERRWQHTRERLRRMARPELRAELDRLRGA